MATAFKKIGATALMALAVALPAAATELTVTVTTDGTTPVADGTVLYAHNDDYSTFAWETTTTGVATFDLADDDYSVAVHMVPGEEDAISGLPAAQSVTLPDTTTLDVELTAAQNTVTGRVVNQAGTALQTDYAVWGAQGEALATGTTANNGTFTVELPAGAYLLSVDTTDDATATDPVWFDFADNSGESIDLGDIVVESVSSDLTGTTGVGTISGTVTDTNETALNCQAVVGVQTNGDGWFYATTNSSGAWSASVAAGAWLVQGVPTGMDVCGDGVALGSLFVPSNGPIADIIQPLATGTARAQLTAPQEVTLTDGGSETADFSFTTADATLGGYVRLASSHDNAGDLASDFHGIVVLTTDDDSSLYENAVWGWARAGRFSLTVPESPEGGYTLTAVSVPLGGAYNVVTSGQYTDDTISTGAVEIAAAETVSDAAVYVLPNDATITGRVQNWPESDTFSVRVCATNRHDTQVCTVTRESTYTLPVAAGVWSVNAIVPENDDVVAATPITGRVTIAAGEEETFPIALDATDATLTGVVKAPSGATLAEALVTAIGEDGQLTAARTDDVGAFSLALPAGYFAVHAQAGGTSTLADSTITQVLLEEDETESVTLTAQNATTEISETVDALPDAQVRLVPANTQSRVTLSDTAHVDIPAYSVLPNDDSLTVRFSPADTLSESSVYPLLNHGYTVDVRTEEGTPLPSFTGGITVTLPYDGDAVTANGWSESDLSLAVYHNGAWEPVNGAIVHTTANTVSAQLHVAGTVAIVGSPLLVLDDLDFSRPNVYNLRVPTAYRGDTWARARWADVLDDKTVQLQVWNSDQDELLRTYQVSGTVIEKVMTDLSSNTKYYVRARTTQNYGDSAWSQWVSFRTRPKDPENVHPTVSALGRKGHGTVIIRFRQPKKRRKLEAQVRVIGAKRNKRLKFKACTVKKRQRRCQAQRYKKSHSVSLQRSTAKQRMRLVVPKKHARKRLKVSIRTRHKQYTAHTSHFEQSSTFRLDQ